MAGNDIPQNLVASFVYELPFGPGKPFAEKGERWERLWAVASVWDHPLLSREPPLGSQVGRPCPSLAGRIAPMRFPGLRSRVDLSDFDPTTDLYLNFNAFSAPAPFTRGNLAPRLPSTRRFATLQRGSFDFQTGSHP